MSRGAPGERRWLAGVFLAPAAVLLLAILFYPLVYSLVRSLFGDGPAGGVGAFKGLSNYADIFTDDAILRSVINNIIWVVVVPAVVTILGLIFAVLTERIRWATAFKTVLFVPMAISGLAVGVTFALIYSDSPSRGLANTVTVGIHDIFAPGTGYPGEHPRNEEVLVGSGAQGYTTKDPVAAGSVVLLPLTGLSLTKPPPGLSQARTPNASSGITGVVWNDFRLGGGGTIGKVDPGELGLKDVTVQALRDGTVVATTQTDAGGVFTFAKLTSGRYQLRLPAQNFGAPYTGLSWLGQHLITWAIILAYLWVYAGFAMVLLAAGMAAIPREALEAARIDGATEWQVFRKITAPLLAPVLLVVFVTMVINVLKVFDLVYIISQSAGADQKYAQVLATELYQFYGNQQYGLASAIGVLLVILVLPAMAFNIRRFRKDRG
ncbi:MAG: ABC transporter permease subunit [Jatrophihabitans sp.]|nr:MAG: ABC transporter permease subunit [Jatrophihabitans sp.]